MVFCCLQEEAENSGDHEQLSKVIQELEELEQRATELDRKRTNNISSIRSVLSQSSAQQCGGSRGSCRVRVVWKSFEALIKKKEK